MDQALLSKAVCTVAKKTGRGAHKSPCLVSILASSVLVFPTRAGCVRAGTTSVMAPVMTSMWVLGAPPCLVECTPACNKYMLSERQIYHIYEVSTFPSTNDLCRPAADYFHVHGSPLTLPRTHTFPTITTSNQLTSLKPLRLTTASSTRLPLAVSPLNSATCFSGCLPVPAFHGSHLPIQGSRN